MRLEQRDRFSDSLTGRAECLAEERSESGRAFLRANGTRDRRPIDPPPRYLDCSDLMLFIHQHFREQRKWQREQRQNSRAAFNAIGRMSVSVFLLDDSPILQRIPLNSCAPERVLAGSSSPVRPVRTFRISGTDGFEASSEVQAPFQCSGRIIGCTTLLSARQRADPHREKKSRTNSALTRTEKSHQRGTARSRALRTSHRLV